MSKISVIGAGAWGTAFANHMAQMGMPVMLWVREDDVCRQIESERVNRTFLPGIRLDDGIGSTTDLDNALANVEYVFWAVPAQHLRDVAQCAKPPANAIHIVMAKGIERNTWRFPFQILEEILAVENIIVLSGPSFAEEVAQGKPTVLVAASKSLNNARRIQHLISGAALRAYHSDDPLGVSLGGAYKNIIAIATGISDGLGFGHNARAALITRGLSELVRLGEMLGARRETLFGAAGVGDMILTCTSKISRNYSLGNRIGQGEKFGDIVDSMIHVAEGAYSTFGALHFAQSTDTELPIAIEVHEILWSGKDPLTGAKALMSRPLKSEW